LKINHHCGTCGGKTLVEFLIAGFHSPCRDGDCSDEEIFYVVENPG